MDDLNAKNIRGIERLIYIMERLRDPEGGCPWDIEQTYETIAPYTIEEAYEVADAIDHKDMAALKDELGDLLLQVIYYTQMAAEDKAFTFDEVVEAISEKMVRRHPHVFGSTDVENAAQQTLAWEELKAKERAEKSDETGDSGGVLAGVAKGLPALLRAFKLQKRAARVGFDWPDVDGAHDKLKEELDELAEEISKPEKDEALLIDEFGDVLFSTVNLARKLGIDPEAALRHGNVKFERRFNYIEQGLTKAGQKFEDVSLEEMEELWQEAKKKP
ncbi:MAG: nucleoside triphosphate pyrophosphohydrolase [Rhodospirillaceae bacterium]|jgi:nucleoside triphosphate diphosphatase|nr:nucleoside triphosphate pyrophosphohydrolase [Rhodospirillaceae bacterium]MBT7954721.1 nucleoside triphosphate pyrophosphohydrolase [Rhodospirillaceae bacterium]